MHLLGSGSDKIMTHMYLSAGAVFVWLISQVVIKGPIIARADKILQKQRDRLDVGVLSTPLNLISNSKRGSLIKLICHQYRSAKTSNRIVAIKRERPYDRQAGKTGWRLVGKSPKTSTDSRAAKKAGEDG